MYFFHEKYKFYMQIYSSIFKEDHDEKKYICMYCLYGIVT